MERRTLHANVSTQTEQPTTLVASIGNFLFVLQAMVTPIVVGLFALASFDAFTSSSANYHSTGTTAFTVLLSLLLGVAFILSFIAVINLFFGIPKAKKWSAYTWLTLLPIILLVVGLLATS